ncbi:MAG: hypothetical protein ACR652_06365 [Methylocystis sp.]|uniref:hypothetical protein n=1 Tax=Methylocystis sp. TaxID=1911079 RepID=UPI003DA45018
MRRLALSLLIAGAACALSPDHAFAKDTAHETASSVLVSPAQLPLDRDGAALLTIPAPGRYSIRSKSPTGARIELVDMIAGPLESSGAAGLRDGRIDALLDKGVYKVRLGAVKDAKGAAGIVVESFSDVDKTRPALSAGAVVGGELGDLQQRSYALEIKSEGPVYLEAVGRALQDLRVWQADGALVDLAFERTTIETRPGRFMNRLRLEGRLEPGRYLVTAYGGEKLAWTDGAAAQPFMLRLAEPGQLAAGVAEGVIGPFGSARYEAPASDDAFRLELPQQAPARLDARRGTTRETASISKSSRAPVATLRLASDGSAPARVDITGHEGQSYVLRALRHSNRETFEAAGPHLVSVDVAGEGGDEAPATALLARLESDGKTRVIASDLPRIGAGKAWRARFNLAGPVSLLFEATRDGPVVVDAKGLKLRATIEPALGSLAPPRASGAERTRYDLSAGFYLLSLNPTGDTGGVVDLTLGPPGLSVPAPVALPARATISFGEQTLENGSYLLLTNTAPQLLAGPRVVPLPVALDKAPLALRQEAGQTLALPLRLPKDGKVIARDATGAEAPLALEGEKVENDQRLVTVKIAPADKARALGLIYVPPAPPAPETATTDGATAGKAARATAGRPAFFDLARDETRRLSFDAPQGGLYRIETLGRLKTALRVGAAVSPKLGEGEANGPGANGLVTTYLRAGAYRAAVTAKDSAGHVGLAVTPAALAPTAKIVDAGESRATLAPGKGAIVLIEITRAGDYRLSLASLTQDLEARIEDADGWPLTKPGAFKHRTQRLEPGAYRLVVSPGDVETRMIARMAPITPETALAGHGPHPLPFGKTQKLQWREPQAKDAPRAPDVWRFALAGDSDVEVAIGEGMIGEVIGGKDESLGKVVGDRPFKAKLAAGAYRIEARSLAHDDRLDYDITLSSPQLQPGAPRRVDLPARLDFTLAADSVVDLSSFGDTETIGVLRNGAGEVVERLEPRANDWNVALSRRLPAGAWSLELEALGPTRGPVTEGSTDEGAGAEDVAQDSQDEAADATADAADDAAAQQDEEEDDSGVEVRLAIMSEKDGAALSAQGETTLAGGGAERLALPAAPPGALAVVAARSAGDVALSIETRGADGVWRVVGAERGLAPAVAWPAPEDGGDWRATVWPVGGGVEPITVAARAIERRAQAAGDVSFSETDIAPQLCVAKIDAPKAALVDLAAPAGVLAGSAPGRLLRGVRSGALAPQAQALWLLTRTCKTKAKVDAFEWLGQDIALDLDAGERAILPAPGAPRGKTRLWLARSTFTQPAIDGGAGMGVADGAALALAGEAPLQMWNASASAPMRATLSAIDVAQREAIKAGAGFSGLVPPMSAQPVELEASDAPLAVDLAGGLAGFVGKTAVFGDGAAASRVIHDGGVRVLLVNMTATPQPARVSRQSDARLTLDDRSALKRFFGAAGQMSLPLLARTGDRLVVIGADATVISAAGRILRGRELTLDGAGELLLDYEPGLVAAWIERNGAAPWPQPTARALTLPQRVTLDGAAARFSLKGDAPAMLSASSGAPALVSFTQNGKRETFAFPAGVEFRHYMGAGEATLDLYAPHDGVLSGALDVRAQPVIEAHEGVNDAIVVAPGAAALFSFETKRDGDIGVGVRSEPDRVAARLFDASGKTLAEGAGQVVKLAPGRYFLEARVPPEARATTIRAAIVGLSPPPAAPPEEIVAELLDKAGMKKSK